MPGQTANRSTEEVPVIHIPLNLDQLRTGFTVLCDLLRFFRVERLLSSVIPDPTTCPGPDKPIVQTMYRTPGCGATE